MTNTRTDIPGISPKNTQNRFKRIYISLEYKKAQYPKKEWTRVFTNGSIKCVKNGGAYIQYEGSKGEESLSKATGHFSSNYRPGATAI